METSIRMDERIDPVYSKLEKMPGKVNSLDELIKALYVVFEGDQINVDYVNELMMNYTSNESDWKKYAKFDRYRYTRNLVDIGNGKFNLIVLCWGEGHASAIHDHSDSHCFMKMLKGELEEVRYAWPELMADGDNPACPIDTISPCRDRQVTCEDQVYDENDMREIGRTRLATNSVCYINDSLGLHRVENPSNSNPAVSLHLYCPPFDSCHVFNQQTGTKTKVPVTFWSKFGEKRDREILDARQPEDK